MVAAVVREYGGEREGREATYVRETGYGKRGFWPGNGGGDEHGDGEEYGGRHGCVFWLGL